MAKRAARDKQVRAEAGDSCDWPDFDANGGEYFKRTIQADSVLAIREWVPRECPRS